MACPPGPRPRVDRAHNGEVPGAIIDRNRSRAGKPDRLWLLARIAQQEEPVSTAALAKRLKLEDHQCASVAAGLFRSGMIAKWANGSIELIEAGRGAYDRLVAPREADLALTC
jgi:hypothetical protein